MWSSFALSLEHGANEHSVWSVGNELEVAPVGLARQTRLAESHAAPSEEFPGRRGGRCPRGGRLTEVTGFSDAPLTQKVGGALQWRRRVTTRFRGRHRLQKRFLGSHRDGNPRV